LLLELRPLLLFFEQVLKVLTWLCIGKFEALRLFFFFKGPKLISFKKWIKLLKFKKFLNKKIIKLKKKKKNKKKKTKKKKKKY